MKKPDKHKLRLAVSCFIFCLTLSICNTFYLNTVEMRDHQCPNCMQCRCSYFIGDCLSSVCDCYTVVEICR